MARAKDGSGVGVLDIDSLGLDEQRKESLSNATRSIDVQGKEGRLPPMSEATMTGAKITEAHPNLVDLGARLPGAIIEASYAGTDNFLGCVVDGYEDSVALISEPAAVALEGVQAELQAMRLTLRIFDAYRPQRAVNHFKRWASSAEDDPERKNRYHPNLARSQIIPEGYIVERSSHSRGSTIDLTIDGLDMGGIFDLFDPRSNTVHPDLSQQQQANRLLLKTLMARHGFQHFPLEWWHFTLADEPWPDRYFDVPVRAPNR